MSRLGLRIPALVWVVLVTMLSIVANAQETTGSISGTISDSTGASVKGAVVTLTNTDRGQDVRTVTTNSSGFYTATSLPLGAYTVKVTAGGFKGEEVTGLVLHVNDALTVNRTLVVGNASEVVTVTADQVQLNLENGMSQGLINGTQVRELVLNNRNYEQLVQLQPGVAYGGANDQLYIGVSLPAGTSNQVAFAINGQRATAHRRVRSRRSCRTSPGPACSSSRSAPAKTAAEALPFRAPRPLPTIEGVSTMPWWSPLGGLIGAFAVVAGLLFVDRVGAGAFAGLTITANILMSLAIDHFGLLRMEVYSMNLGRGAGGVLLVAGIALITRF